MSSVREIAKRAGVSITTVSRVLNNHPNVSSDVRESVLAAANETRYVAAVGRRDTNNVALVYTGELSWGSPYDAALLRGIGDGFDDFPYDLSILDLRRARRADETYTAMFMRKGIRGAILRATMNSRAVCESIAAEGFPVVAVGERFEDTNIPYVYSDSFGASSEAVSTLIGLGHKRIAVTVNVVDDSDHQDRLAGYRDALQKAGIEVDPQLIWRVPATREGGIQVIKRVEAMPDRPTAVYIADPLACVGAIGEARRVGMEIPADLSIVGFDDADLRMCMVPALSAVCQNAATLGYAALSLLDEIMNQSGTREINKVRKSACWFELHDTVGRPK